VIAPARSAPRGLPRVWALCDNKLRYLERHVFPGGCFFANTSMEFSHRPGPVRDRIEDMLRAWRSYLEHAVETAQLNRELDDSISAREITFELDSFAVAANWQYHLFGDPAVFDRARRATRERLESLRVSKAA
jgi:tetracycline repressor-like protein